MADNTILNPGSGGDVIAADEVTIGGTPVKVQRVKIGYGGDGNWFETSSIDPLPVGGGIASGSPDAGGGVKAAAVYNAGIPTFDDGDRADLQTDSRGSLKVTITASGTTAVVFDTGGVPDGVAAQAGISAFTYPHLFNGVNMDRWRGDATYGAFVNLKGLNGQAIAAGEGPVTSGTQRVVQAASPTYRAYVPSQAAGANKVYFDVFNAAGSGKVLRVRSVRAIKNGSVAVTGTLSVQLFLTRTTAVGTGGTAATLDGSSLTAMTISEMDTNSAALPAGITGRLGPTAGATAGAVISERHVWTEETGNAGYEHPEFLNLPNVGTEGLVLREGQGLRVVQGTVASVGNIGFEVLFTAD